jgi:glycosyltransferase involved in cell wall biosynthesis
VKELKNKTIILCLPGREYSGDFLCSFTELVSVLKEAGAKVKISQRYSSMVNSARCLVAGADVMRGEHQKPFNGMHYDYMMWIDSDMQFNPDLFFQLYNMDKDIASGWYAQPGAYDGNFFTPVVEKMDNKYFISNGTFQFLRVKDFASKKNPFIADYVGFGWILIKQGVFEKLSYPWFAPRKIRLSDTVADMCSEDVAFCLDAREAGFDIWVHPKVRTGHEKTMPI